MIRLSITKCFLFFVLISVGGCSAQSFFKMKQHTSPRSNTGEIAIERPPALMVLKDTGLVANDDYSSANYIPNSDNTMIIATLRNAPCKIIFLHIKTNSGDYWMPNQIGCSP